MNVPEAESYFQQSLEEAQKHKNKVWELRTSISLANLWNDRNERRKAQDFLLPIYDSYTEGLESPLMQKAKNLLRQMG